MKAPNSYYEPKPISTEFQVLGHSVRSDFVYITAALSGLVVGLVLTILFVAPEAREYGSFLRAQQTIKEDAYTRKYNEAVREHFANQKPEAPKPVKKNAVVTAYSCGGLKTPEEILMNCPSLFSGAPMTADGTHPVPYKTIACDRANLGRTFELESVGIVKCTDTGGAINGAGRFDLYVEDVQSAKQWGVREIAYTVIGE